ncbi:MAG: hypothetical protein ACTSPN_15085 [Promethearchaeota archaeon]
MNVKSLSDSNIITEVQKNDLTSLSQSSNSDLLISVIKCMQLEKVDLSKLEKFL